MKSRYKTYKEFIESITLVHDQQTGYKIICNLKSYVVVQSKVKPWNTPETRKSFLVKLYITQVLQKHTMSKRFPRIEGYELLGRRCMYNDYICIVCDSVELVHRETGEVKNQLTLFGDNRSNPFKVLINQVQL